MMEHHNLKRLGRSAHEFKVLISGRDSLMLEHIRSNLDGVGNNISLECVTVVNGHVDPLHGVDSLPDLLVLHLSDRWQSELSALCDHTPQERPPLLIIGDSQNPDMMRLGMQVGARDFLTEPVNIEDLTKTVTRMETEKYQVQLAEQGSLTAVINAKGGSGATMMACNIAHMMQVVEGEEVILLDMDMQFGSLAQYFDIKPENGVIEALKVVDDLDATALSAYLLKHASGLKVMGATLNEFCMPSQIPESRIALLLEILRKHCSQLVVDVPRAIDQATAAVLTQATQIVVVVQQDFINIKDASHLMQMLQQELGIIDDQIVVAVNRVQKNTQVSIADIRETLHAKHLVTIANDYPHVLESLNKGEPLYNIARRSALTRSLLTLQHQLINGFPEQNRGFISRVFSRLNGA
ncbi:AAA family ATPase [uncultured Amphritea sp.]|uniref:AAA family ATPase n=1 Tax=Amphritea sp. TaxID=1872502 RepID=UPI0025F7177D|nr:AAA family ATPase [uncultured Amphritea sp.]